LQSKFFPAKIPFFKIKKWREKITLQKSEFTLQMNEIHSNLNKLSRGRKKGSLGHLQVNRTIQKKVVKKTHPTMTQMIKHLINIQNTKDSLTERSSLLNNNLITTRLIDVQNVHHQWRKFSN
jgi:hypothetical protein